MVFKHAQEKIERASNNPRWRELLEKEYTQFKETVGQWQQLQVQRVQLGRQKLVDVFEQNALTMRYRELERELKLQRKRVAMLAAQFIG